MPLIHSLSAIKISLDRTMGYDIIFSMPSLHKIYSKNSLVKCNLPSGRLLNTINLFRRGFTLNEVGFLF